MTEKEVFGWLSEIQHPGKDDKDIVSLGMVDEVEVADGKVVVTLAFGKRPDPLKNYLEGAVRAAVYSVPVPYIGLNWSLSILMRIGSDAGPTGTCCEA